MRYNKLLLVPIAAAIIGVAGFGVVKVHAAATQPSQTNTANVDTPEPGDKPDTAAEKAAEAKDGKDTPDTNDQAEHASGQKDTETKD